MSISQEATATDFKNWQTRAKDMTIAELSYAIVDCKEAAKAMQGHNPVKSNKYMDEAFTYADERRARQMKDSKRKSTNTTKGN